MSKIKSDDSDITIDASGSGRDIKFQANGVEKASISSAGAFTSTTIDATKLTGTIPNFTSTGIDDNADATAITISSAENVGIGATSPSTSLHLKDNATGANTKLTVERSSLGYTGEYAASHCGTVTNNEFDLHTNNTLRLRLTSDGRGLSQFTAKAWVNFDGTGTAAIRDSHNVSSITDNGTGDFTVTFSNNMGNTNYCTSIGNYRSTGDTGIGGSNIMAIAVGSIRFETIRDSSSKIDPNFCNFLVFGD